MAAVGSQSPPPFSGRKSLYVQMAARRAANRQKGTCFMNELLYGVAYYDEYMPYERLQKDMEREF